MDHTFHWKLSWKYHRTNTLWWAVSVTECEIMQLYFSLTKEQHNRRSLWKVVMAKNLDAFHKVPTLSVH